MPLPLFLARLSKLLMVAGLAGFALLVGWNNVVDYGSNFAFADGSVRYIDGSIDRKVWYALITRDGGEAVRRDEY